MVVRRQHSTAADGPTIVRLILGSQLRRLRERRGITRTEAGDHIRGTEWKTSPDRPGTPAEVDGYGGVAKVGS